MKLVNKEGISPTHECEYKDSPLCELTKRFSGELHALCPDGSLLPVEAYHPEEGVYCIRSGSSLLTYNAEKIKLFREVS